MDTFIRGRQFTPETTGDMVVHHCRMTNSVVPELGTDLFLGNVGPGHLDESTPRTLDKAIRGLTTSGGSNNITFVGQDVLESLAADEFLVEV